MPCVLIATVVMHRETRVHGAVSDGNLDEAKQCAVSGHHIAPSTYLTRLLEARS